MTEQPINDRRRARARADRPGRPAKRASGAARAWRVLFGVVVLIASLTAFGGPASAVQSVRVSVDSDAIDLTRAVERYSAQGDRIQVSTAPGADGIVRRIEVSAVEPGAQPAWIVFALTNDSDEQLTRLIVAPHFRFVGSGVIWPDLGSSRIATITASQGSAPEREDNPEADVFRLTLDPGTTVTYVAELRTPNLPQLYLWEPDAFKDKSTSLTLYEGILIGIAGLLALFLTIVFVVRGAMIFPAAAALAWAVFAYVCIDFGFWRKMFGLEDATERIWRAGVEATIGATLIVFLFAYLNLRRWHVRYTHFALAWLALMAAVVGLSVYNAPVAAGVARISIATVAGLGFLLILSLAARGSDRAVMLIPTWYLLAVWVVAAGAAALGYLTNDLAAPGLVGGLVLIVMLIGFTVMQFAFSGSGGAVDSGPDAERRSLAMTGSGEGIFDWNVLADEVSGSEAIESQLGLKRGALEGPAAGWLDVLHPLDRDRYTLALDGLLHQRSGRINHDLRLRGSDGHYFWYVLKARPVISADGEVVRVIGSLSDVTELKSAEERMLHDAVHDNLTGLPNRELFNDRLGAAILMAQKPGGAAPTVMIIDIDEFQSVNDSYGLSIGDSALLAVARRLARDLNPGDTLARLGGDTFGAIVLAEPRSMDAPARIDALRAALAAPISFGEREIALTVSIGAAHYDPKLHGKGGDLLADAQLALANAKKGGGDRVEIFAHLMRSQRSDRQTLENDMRRALERGEISILFRPIVRLEDRTVAGFQSLLRWRHPRLGVLDEDEFSSAAEFDRRNRRHRRLCARGDGEGAGGVAEGARGQSADLRHRRRVIAPDAQPRFAFRRARRARPPLRAARLAQARGGGEPGDGKPRIRRGSFAEGARNRRRADAGQVRRRLYLARPSAAVSLRRHADRRLPGQAELVRRALADPAFDRRHGAGDRDGRHLRGRGDGIRRGRARSARLPVRPRGGLRPADEPGRGAKADGRGGRLTEAAALQRRGPQAPAIAGQHLRPVDRPHRFVMDALGEPHRSALDGGAPGLARNVADRRGRGDQHRLAGDPGHLQQRVDRAVERQRAVEEALGGGA